MGTNFARLLGIAVLTLPLASLASEPSRTMSDQQWQQDLQQISASIKEIHFKPFHNTTEAAFDSAVDKLDARIAELSDAEIIVEMAQIVASLRDGHTRLHIPRLYPELALIAELGHSGTPPPKHEELKFRQWPLRFEWFSDGLYIVGATTKYRKHLGKKVLYFDDTPVDKALEQVRSVSFFENDSRAKLMAPDRLALPDVTQILNISHASDVMTLTTVDTRGKESKLKLKSLTRPGQRFISGAPSPLPLWQAKTDEYRWYQVLPDSDAIYLQVNEFEENPVTPYGDFVAEALGAARQAGVSRFIVDLRHNSGGIGAWVTPFVTGLVRSEFNEYGRLFVLVGRTTFSAAQHFMHEFEKLSYAAFVGEPSGAKPSHYGDGKRVTLENSGLTLRVSTIYWHSWLANDFRDAIQPHISAPISSTHYFDGIDPVLDAALAYQAPDTLALQIDEQFRQGKNQNALLLFGRYMSDATIGNHREAIPGLLAMADKLVEDGMTRPGYFVYFLADRSYPGDPRIEAGLKRIEPLLD